MISLRHGRRWFCQLVIVGLLIGCSAKYSPEASRNMLVGTFWLHISSACISKGVVRDELILHANGRLEQHALLTNGKKYDASNERWSYVPDDSVSLNNWLDLTDNPTGKPVGATLLVELKHPPMILVNPDSDCVYVKQSSSNPRD